MKCFFFLGILHICCYLLKIATDITTAEAKALGGSVCQIIPLMISCAFQFLTLTLSCLQKQSSWKVIWQTPEWLGSNWPILCNYKQTFTYSVFWALCPSLCPPVGNGQLKAEMPQPFMSLFLVFINSLAKVEMLWGVLKVVSGMSLLVSCHYALLPANICMARQSTLWAVVGEAVCNLP